MKRTSKKGFTLMEMLIVIAIIAILIAIAIPVFTAQLNKAKLSTDKSNARALKSMVVTNFMSYVDDQSNSASIVKGTGATFYMSTDGNSILTSTDDAMKCQSDNTKYISVTWSGTAVTETYPPLD